MGADVIRIEPPEGGRLRSRAPFLDGKAGAERSFYHLFHNANKRSVILDIATAEGAAALRGLAATADILVETGTPGEMASLGLSFMDLSPANPALIYVSITPFGQTGPWCGRAGTDLTAAAAGGLLYPSGGTDDPPMHGNADPSYKMAALQAATGALIALRGRALSGRGAHLDISVQEATAMAMVQQLNPNIYLTDKRVPKRSGLHGPLLLCSDGSWVGVRVRPDRFRRFLDWAEREGVKTDLRPESLASMQAGEQDINLSGEILGVLRSIAGQLTLDQMLKIAWDLDLIALPVGRFPDMAGRDHFVATRQFFPVWHEALGVELGFTRSPVDGLAGGVPVRRAPLLGEHTTEVLASTRETPPFVARAAAEGHDPAKPLAGLRVIDFTWVLAGPFGTRILANFGAEVIKVESHARPDTTRGNTPRGARSLDVGALFNDANAGKRSLTLDLNQEEAKALLRRLVAKADVVANNYRPGALERMGFGYEELRAINPRIILLNLPGCGKEGPWAERGTLGGVLMAASGLNDISGFEGRPPYGIATAYPDFTSPYLLAMTVLAAVHERERSGVGQEVTVNQLSATIGLLGVEWMRFTAEGRLARNANRNPNYCPHGVYPALGNDDWIAIALEGEAQWAALCDAMARPELAADARFASHAARLEHDDDVDALVGEWTSRLSKWQAAGLLQSQGIAAAAVESLRDMLESDAQLAHRRHYQHVRQPSEPGLDIVIDGEAIHFAGIERTLVRAPMMGEHNEEVLRSLAGLGESEFDALVVKGVVN